MKPRLPKPLPLTAIGLLACSLAAAAQTARVTVQFDQPLGPMNMDHMSLGQGGLSAEPMWSDRIAEIRSLRPKVIRLFVQEYFELLPDKDHTHFDTLDKSIDAILAAGATPLMCICFKPHILFPAVDQDKVEPSDYALWEDLISKLVKHCLERKAGVLYWEVANEPDIGEDGGCPYRFKPESYIRYYQHTAAAILRADPDARVGGPALAGSHSALLPALLDFCETNRVPLRFVSWHIYSSDPKSIRATVDYVKELLGRHAGLKPETFLDEWNMDLMNPNLDPRFQPCFICETVWQMKDAGLDYSCYYHLRDWHVRLEDFTPFMSAKGAAFMTRWWNRMPQFDGLFDYENQVRPSYFAWKLLSRVRGERLRLSSDHPSVRGLASHDQELRCDNLLLWNFSSAPAPVELALKGLDGKSRMRHVALDALAPSSDENSRLHPDPFVKLDRGDKSLNVTLEPYAVHYWYFE
ncbi:MAG TPA: hypothetical protein VL793_04880 [Patescibacteria group bacterium]|nr:hypothetical protein [Patescibacteria group bacterium]